MLDEPLGALDPMIRYELQQERIGGFHHRLVADLGLGRERRVEVVADAGDR